MKPRWGRSGTGLKASCGVLGPVCADSRLLLGILILRSQYRNVAGQKEYDASVTSKPPDPLTTDDETILRRDVEYLLNEFYLRYSLTSCPGAFAIEASEGGSILYDGISRGRSAALVA